MMNILSGQGYKMKQKYCTKITKVPLKLEINGRNSCTGNSKHIAMRYFFVKDSVDKGEFVIEYCPMLSMLAGYFTNPLQEAQFKLLREIIMGWKHVDSLLTLSSKERVGNKVSNNMTEIARTTYG